ncbi:MAG: hypothetical protein LUE87_07110, partial [Lachnospiraceae bacterium]|nr:hypothetical protein [Lachnospiraceae bacterium]
YISAQMVSDSLPEKAALSDHNAANDGTGSVIIMIEAVYYSERCYKFLFEANTVCAERETIFDVYYKNRRVSGERLFL